MSSTDSTLSNEASAPVICFGKYKAFSIADVMVRDPAYCEWLSKISVDGVCKQNKKELKEYLSKHFVASPTEERSVGSWVLKFGKHKGLTLDNVIEQDPDWVSWFLTTPANSNYKADKIMRDYMRSKTEAQHHDEDFPIKIDFKTGNYKLDTHKGKYKGWKVDDIIEDDPEHLINYYNYTHLNPYHSQIRWYCLYKLGRFEQIKHEMNLKPHSDAERINALHEINRDN